MGLTSTLHRASQQNMYHSMQVHLAIFALAQRKQELKSFCRMLCPAGRLLPQKEASLQQEGVSEDVISKVHEIQP